MSDQDIAAVVRAVAREHGTPDDVVAAVLARMLPSIRLLSQPPTTTELPVGASRIGGRPDLPAGTDWPRRADAAGEAAEEWEPDLNAPLQFILQVNLAEAAPFDVGNALPHTGLLSFFFYWDEYTSMGEEVAYIVLSPPSGLHRVAVPDDLPADQRYRPLALRPCLEWTIPSIMDSGVEGGADPFSAFPHFRFWDDSEARLAAVQGLPEPRVATATTHRLLGHPQMIQSPGLADGTKLLLQADSDGWRKDGNDHSGTGMMWGDRGRLYYLIDDAALRAHRLTKQPWVTVEMC